MKVRKVLACLLLAASLAILPAFGFKPWVHGPITREALFCPPLSSCPDVTVSLGGETLQFLDDAILHIVISDGATDFDQFESSKHFDDESFSDSSGKLGERLQNIINFLNGPSPNGFAARNELGTALHAVQDFYSHTNWVELGHNDIEPLLGLATFSGPLTDKPCLDDGDNLSEAGRTTLTSGYYSPSTLCAFFKPIGKCGHGDFPLCPGGISKDKEGRKNFPEARTLAVQASRKFVRLVLDSIRNDPEITDKGKAIKALMGIKPGTVSVSAAKSTLGVVIDDTNSMAGTIDQVKTAVRQIVNSVVRTPKEPAQYLLERFGDPDVGPPFVTDSSAAFLDRVNALFVHGEGNVDCPELQMTGLLQAVAAAQPGSTLFLFTDDTAKDAFEADSVVAAARRKQIQILFVLAPPSCAPGHSPRDPAYDRVAQGTGGQVFDLQTLEIARIGALLGKVIAGDQALLLAAAGSFPGATAASTSSNSTQGQQELSAQIPEGAVVKNTALFPPRLPNLGPVLTVVSSPQTFTVAVDSSATTLTFSISVAVKGAITLSRPSGAPVLAGQPGVTFTDLSTGQIITVDSPEAGNWHLQVGGAGPFSVLALESSSIQFHSFEFVALTGRPGHEGLFPIAGQPVSRTGQTVLARLLGITGPANFSLISETGTILQSVSLAKGNPNTGPDDLVSTLDLPAQPFRVLLTGQDAKGFPFQRIFPTFFRVQSVEVAATTPFDTLIAGTTTTISFAVRNLGAADTFQVVVTDDRGFISRVDPTSLTLAANASGSVAVNLTVPGGTAKGTRVSVSAAATSTTDQTIANGTTQLLTVVTNNALPAVSSLSPSNTTAGVAAFNLDVVGSNFVPGAIVRWNGSGRTTTFVSDSKLTASIPASDIAVGSKAQVTVFNPTPGGGTSGALTFAVADFSVAASPSSATVRAGQSATYTLTVTPQFGSFGNAISPSCSNLPALSSCSFSPSTLTPGANPAASTLTVSTTASSVVPAAPASRYGRPPLPNLWPALILLALIAAVIVAHARKERRLITYMPLVALLVLLAIHLLACGGRGETALLFTPRPGTPTGNFNITVKGSSGSLERSTTVTLVVQ